jgi:hypothetical protein
VSPSLTFWVCLKRDGNADWRQRGWTKPSGH